MTRTYVLDTSVLLADPRALRAFHEHSVVVPIAVLIELEAKRHHPELGYAARKVLRELEDLRQQHGSLTKAIPVNDDGGTVRVELNHQDTATLPPGLTDDSNDNRILTVATNLALDHPDVVLVTNDLPLRLRASIANITAEDYRHNKASDPDWTGIADLEVTPDELMQLRLDGELRLGEQIAPNTCLIVRATTGGTMLARVQGNARTARLVKDQEWYGVSPRSAEQRFAMDLLADPSVGIVSLGGPAGTGKSVLALAGGLAAGRGPNAEQTKIVVFRPIHAVGAQDLGYLPGSADEKMEPWAEAVFDAFDAFAHPHVVSNLRNTGALEVRPLTHIRGRTLSNSWVIIDEAQNLEASVLLTALSRIGQGSKVILTHDVAQRDNLRVGRHDGIAAVIERLRGDPLFGHVRLRRPERSGIAALATRVLDNGL